MSKFQSRCGVFARSIRSPSYLCVALPIVWAIDIGSIGVTCRARLTSSFHQGAKWCWFMAAFGTSIAVR